MPVDLVIQGMVVGLRPSFQFRIVQRFRQGFDSSCMGFFYQAFQN